MNHEERDESRIRHWYCTGPAKVVRRIAEYQSKHGEMAFKIDAGLQWEITAYVNPPLCAEVLRYIGSGEMVALSGVRTPRKEGSGYYFWANTLYTDDTGIPGYVGERDGIGADKNGFPVLPESQLDRERAIISQSVLKAAVDLRLDSVKDTLAAASLFMDWVLRQCEKSQMRIPKGVTAQDLGGGPPSESGRPSPPDAGDGGREGDDPGWRTGILDIIERVGAAHSTQLPSFLREADSLLSADEITLKDHAEITAAVKTRGIVLEELNTLCSRWGQKAVRDKMRQLMISEKGVTAGDLDVIARSLSEDAGVGAR